MITQDQHRSISIDIDQHPHPTLLPPSDLPRFFFKISFHRCLRFCLSWISTMKSLFVSPFCIIIIVVIIHFTLHSTFSFIGLRLLVLQRVSESITYHRLSYSVSNNNSSNRKPFLLPPFFFFFTTFLVYFSLNELP